MLTIFIQYLVDMILTGASLLRQLCLAVSTGEMFRQAVCSGLSLLAEGHQQVLRSVSALVLKRCNSTVAITQARPEDWDYAKPFEDIPGPKPLPIVGNTWRFIPYLGNVFRCSIVFMWAS
jgi:hypothetical protein